MRVLGWIFAVLVALVALVAVGVVVADQPLRSYAQDVTATALQKQVPFDERPTVTLEGWPLVYSALGGSLTAKVTADGMPVTASGKTLTLSNLDAVATGVRVSPDQVSAVAVAGSANLTYAELSRFTGSTIRYADGGRLAYVATIDVFGQQIEAGVSALPKLDVAAQTLEVEEPTAFVAGIQVPVGVIVGAFVDPIPFELKYGMRLTELTATDAGLRAAVAGADLAFPIR